jgi:hypothetical protein
MGAWIPRWLLDAPLLLTALWVWLDPRLRFPHDWSRRQAKMVALLVWSVLLEGNFLVSVWSANGVLSGRVLNWLYFLSILGGLVNLLLWKPAQIATEPSRALGLPIRSCVMVGAFAAMLFAGNPWLGAVDLALRIPAWHRARAAALVALESAPKDQAARLPVLPPTPQMYFDFDAAVDPTEFPNRCLARYFQLPSVESPNGFQGNVGAALSGRTYGLLKR